MTKLYFTVKWIGDLNGRAVETNSMVKSTSAKGACSIVEKRNGYIDVIGVTMRTGFFISDKKIETFEDYTQMIGGA